MKKNRLAEEVHTFLTALTFFTRIPFPSSSSYSEERQARCAAYLPLIGWSIGGFAALIFTGAHTVFPKSVAIVLSMAATVWLTGALHEDGVADFCDGFGGGWTKERILEIMKDSRLGTYGTVGLGVILSLKGLCLNEMPATEVCLTLVAGHSLSRFFSVSFMLTHAYAGGGPASKAGPLCARMSKTGFAFAGLTGLLPLILFKQPGIFLCLLPMGFIHWMLGRFLTRRIGGYTGDCLGAAQQFSEAAFYLFVLGWTWTST